MNKTVSRAVDIGRKFQQTGLTPELITSFQELIYHYFQENGRSLPWRETNDPYEILVSEVMLQQTPVERVVTQYGSFLKQFPSVSHLAQASLRDILLAWQGLGYNRRAKSLQALAQRVVQDFDGRLPAHRKTLESLPGIGAATAGAVLAFAYEEPVVFLETNIRRVFLHFFYPEAERVSDKELMPLAFLTLDYSRVRQWYYALMDYGAMLKKIVPNPNRRSAHYSRQSLFRGSDREIRSKIVQLLLHKPVMPEATILATIGGEADRVQKILHQLVQENFLIRQADSYLLASGLKAVL